MKKAVCFFTTLADPPPFPRFGKRPYFSHFFLNPSLRSKQLHCQVVSNEIYYYLNWNRKPRNLFATAVWERKTVKVSENLSNARERRYWCKKFIQSKVILVAFFIGPKCSLGPKAPYSLCSFFLMHRSKSFIASGTWQNCEKELFLVSIKIALTSWFESFNTFTNSPALNLSQV